MVIEFTLFFNNHFHDSCDYWYYNNVCLKNKIVAFGQQYPRDAHLPADKQASLHSMTVGPLGRGLQIGDIMRIRSHHYRFAHQNIPN